MNSPIKLSEEMNAKFTREMDEIMEKQASSEIAQSQEPDLGPNWGKGGSSADVEGMFSVIGLRKALAHSEANLKEAVRRKRVKDQIIRDLRNKLAAVSPPSPEQETLTHSRSCQYWDSEGGCTCSLDVRIALQTEQTMHNAWRKRAEEAEGDTRELKAALKESKKMTDDQIKHMVNRFLAWRLPENFNPDGGIIFKRTFNENTSHPMKHEPVGTNLLDAMQAEEMIRYLVDGLLPEKISMSIDAQLPQAWETAG